MLFEQGKGGSMCRLLGYASPWSRTTESVLGGAQSGVFQDMALLHRDGWGTAWLDDSGDAPAEERLAALRSPESGVHNELLTGVLTERRSRARITHLRMATDGMLCEPQNTHPFLADGMAFAHNGSLAPVSVIEEHIAPDIAAQLQGETDSERYFAVIRSALKSGLGIVDAVVSAVSELRELFPTASMNALILSSTHLIAVHASEGAHVPFEDFDASGLSESQLPSNHRTGYYLMRQRRLEDGTIVFASSGLDIIGWEALPPETTVAVDLATLETESRPIRPRSLATSAGPIA